MTGTASADRRKVLVVTTSRADYGIYRPLLKRIAAEADLQLGLVVGGAHLEAPVFGDSLGEIERDGFEIEAKVPCIVRDDRGTDYAASIAMAVSGFARVFRDAEPSVVFVLGDRFEMYGAALAAVATSRMLAHLHGGEVTTGAIDDMFRHSISKFAHVHFASAEVYALRLSQLGEESHRIHNVGALSLDAFASMDRLGIDALNASIGAKLEPGFLLATFHPETLCPLPATEQVKPMLEVLATCARQVLVTGSNADSGGDRINGVLKEFVSRSDRHVYVETLGHDRYAAALSHAAAMIGNSSSGIAEAGFFRLPVVNIGDRQGGRLRGKNVIDCANEYSAIGRALEEALAPGFREHLSSEDHPYGDGRAAERIVRHLRIHLERAAVAPTTPSSGSWTVKRFADWPPPQGMRFPLSPLE